MTNRAKRDAVVWFFVEDILSASEKSTFFPMAWSDTKIIQEIAFARANLTAANYRPAPENIWRGTASNGITIDMYIIFDTTNPILPSPTADYGSAYPKL